MTEEHKTEPEGDDSPGSVFGNLPDSRPGSRSPRRRSGKGGGAAKAKAKPAAKAKPKRAAKPKARAEAARGAEATAERAAGARARARGGRARRRSRGPRLGRGRRGGRGGHPRRTAREPGDRIATRELGRARLTVGEAERSVSDHASARFLRVFWERAYRENVTGLAAMVAYNLALALFPFALLVLFIFGQVIQNPDVEASVLRDLESLFPAAEQSSIGAIVDRIRDSSATIGVVAAVGAIWIGASFWGAMDTAFCRIYHVQCRGWVEQKRFALLMLIVVTIFLAASVVIPVAEALLASGAENLPFGLDQVGGVRSVALLAAALVITFAVCALIYYVVPKGHVPWRGVWPGALFVTLTTAIANAIFPFYLGQSNVDELGGALGFILVALIWFYLVSLGLMAGAVINALRFEFHETGSIEEERARAFAESA